ncbi:MAG: uroporphyrinogen decarboxylase family protein [Thermoguttaceae bacterium]
MNRIAEVLQGHSTKPVPIMLHNLMSAVREAGMTMQQFRSSPQTIATAFLQAYNKYELDGIVTDVDTALEAFALGAPTDFPEDLPAKVVAPAAERLEEVIEMVQPEKLKNDARIQDYLEAISLMHHELGNDGFLRGNADQGPFSLAMSLYGTTNMMIDMLDETRSVPLLELIERCFQVHLQFHLMVKEAGADITSFGDSFCGPDLISPKLYRKFAAPFQKRLADELRNRGIQTVCHICGNTDLILEDLASIGFAGLEIDYKTNIPLARKLLRNRSVVFGVIDPSGVFCHGTPEIIRKNTETVLDIFTENSNTNGLVIGAGCALPAETPSGNIRVFIETVRNRK